MQLIKEICTFSNLFFIFLQLRSDQGNITGTSKEKGLETN